MAWSSALDRHVADELAPLYATRVSFYGHRLTGEQVVAAKRKALQLAPAFRQRVTNVSIQKAPNGYTVTFEKRSGAELRSIVGARLGLEASGTQLLIAEESDAVTDARFSPKTAAKTCTEAVFSALDHHPVITSDQERVAREYPEVNPGGLSYDERPDRLEASEGYFHPERYEARWWITAADGVLKVRDAYTDQLLSITEADRRAIRQLCSGKSDPPEN
jgi:hypothetical protein